MIQHSKIENRDPADLAGHIHSALKTIPELAEDSAEFKAIAAGVGKCGIIQPLLIDEKNRVLDDHSRTLLRCARRWQLKSVPVLVRESSDVHLLIIHSLAHRRHLSKSAIAYLAVPHLDAAFEISKSRRFQNIAKNPTNLESPVSGLSEKTVDELADALGVGRTALFEARKVHKEFESKTIYTFNIQGGALDGDISQKTLRAFFEPRILQAFVGGEHEQNRPLGLGGVIAGIASVKTGDTDKFNPKNKNQLDLFTRASTDGITRWTYWEKLSDSDKQKHFKTLRSTIAGLPPEQCEAMAEYHAKLAGEFRAAAKKEVK